MDCSPESGPGSNPGMNWIYSTPQIFIPPQLPHILKQYIKAAIRTQPHDLLTWSAYYFKCVHAGMIPPVKKHLEFPIFAAPGSLTPGFLHVLIHQLGREGYVRTSVLSEKWLGLTLNKCELDRMLLLRHYRGKVDIMEFVAIAAGHLCKTLSATMTLVCELLTLEPEGGSAKIPLPWFIHLYRMLADLDCAPARQDEIVVQDIILPFGERESKLWSIPEGVSPAIKDFIRKHFQTVEADINAEEENEDTGPVCSDVCLCPDKKGSHVGPCPEGLQDERVKVKRTKRVKVKGPCVKDTYDHGSEEGLQVWDDTCKVGAEKLPVCRGKDLDEAAETPPEGEEEEGDHVENSNENLADVKSDLSLGPLSVQSFGQEDNVSDMDEKKLLEGQGEIPAKASDSFEEESCERSYEEESIVPSDDMSQISLKTIGEILLRYHVSGIGPKLSQWQIAQVIDFMETVAQKQDGYVMPRNIRHRACPPLDRIEQEEVSLEKGEDSNYSSLNSGGVRF
ncbi:hypothetical protein WDU94_001013 [Cyamophila willieti]